MSSRIDVIIDRYSKKQIGDQELKELHDWIEQSSCNRDYFVQKMDESLMVAMIENDPYISDVKKLCKKKTILTKGKFYFLSAVAAALMIFFSIQLLSVTDVPIERYRTSNGERKVVTLADGSIVSLNGNSMLTYQEYGDSVRKVTLTGEGYFEVSSNQKMPFVVDLSGVKISVIGTSFNVRSLEQEREVAIRLDEGRVGITTQGKLQYLSPNQEFIYNRLTHQSDVVEKDGYVDWKTGGLEFKQCTLGEVIERLKSHYGYEVHLIGNVSDKYQFTGTFQNKEIHAVLEAIKFIIPIRYDVNENVITISPK